MLVLTRKPGQELIIGGNIRVKVLSVSGGRIRLGIAAPPEVDIVRDDVVPHESNDEIQTARELVLS
ncbi:MAG: carbon storage regulator [Planctomycetia bacterium]